jgi:hypothetical protein
MCTAQKTGNNCQLAITYCTLHPDACGENGACLPEATSQTFSCACSDGFGGTLCDVALKKDESSPSIIPAAVGGIIGGVVVIIVIIVVVWLIRRNNNRKVPISRPHLPVKSALVPLVPHSKEIPEKDLVLHEVIGSGNFGRVFRATYNVWAAYVMKSSLFIFLERIWRARGCGQNPSSTGQH